ncbi:cytochrome b/b6 domain-containing protein [Xanthobacter agilis]|jgi:cytochrome b|uniref:Cytochrome b n=1 Tax=Xanthobacter agilis TaxID=47492 RepID=A0ABU0LA83_XANAG|nr:cytochrome b/b6 domain-containing protein [Xanthobacter agilis]MDQ0504040.1 cytochrome b [Xanthobacter agilis]
MTETLLRDAAPSPSATADARSTKTGAWRWIKVWDAPTRLFHWALVALVVTSYVTARNGWIDWHFYAGYAILTLVGFRILWGLAGSETSRFSAFVRAPGAAIAHLRHVMKREGEPETGHNAAGAYMVLALLALLLFQTVSGLFSNDGLFTGGPLADLVSGEVSDQITVLHGLSFDLIVIAVALHVAAIIAYAVLLRQDLVRPMITGWKRLPPGIPAPRLAPLPLALVLAAIAAAAVFAITRLG